MWLQPPLPLTIFFLGTDLKQWINEKSYMCFSFVLGRSVGRLLLTFKIEAGFICFNTVYLA